MDKLTADPGARAGGWLQLRQSRGPLHAQDRQLAVGQPNYDFLDSFLNTLADGIRQPLRLTDFMADPEAARVRINQLGQRPDDGEDPQPDPRRCHQPP